MYIRFLWINIIPDSELFVKSFANGVPHAQTTFCRTLKIRGSSVCQQKPELCSS
jgi:hypothetical protein